MVHSTPREHLARRRANELLDEASALACPVEPDQIAAAKGLHIEEWDQFPEGCYGALIRGGNTFLIAVSTRCFSPGHRKFTVAHELAHFHIEDHVERMGWSGPVALSMGGHFRSQKDPIEVEADHFASELLLPTRLVQPLIDRASPCVSAIRSLARQFDTSLSCAAIRFADLTTEPTVVILSCNRVIEWAAFSRDLKYLDWARFRRHKGEWAPPGSATLRLAQDPGTIATGKQDSACGLLCEWFEDAPPVYTVEEEAVGLGRFGRVLTVLTCVDLPDPDELYADEDEEMGETGTGDWRDALRPY